MDIMDQIEEYVRSMLGEYLWKIKRPLNKMSGYFSEKRGLKNIYEKLCLKYIKISSSFNIQSINNSKESINSSKIFGSKSLV